MNLPSKSHKFTGKERDSESGLDNFGARYYSNRFGRWLSADWSAVPEPIPYANLSNPQTLNLYSMVADDPESFADLDGHCGPLTPVCELLSNPAVQEEIEDWGTQAIAAGGALLGVLGTALSEHPAYPFYYHGEFDKGPPGSSFAKSNTNAKSQPTQSPQQNQSTPANAQGPKYEPNPKHDQPSGDDRKGVSPQPKAGGSLMDQAVQVKQGSSVAVDRSSGKFVVYKTDANGQTHGYETTWKGLRNDQRAALIKSGLTTKRGKIITPAE
jgi:RHS repeat-associated protein